MARSEDSKLSAHRVHLADGLSRILEHTNTNSIALLTAFRGDLTKSENKQRNKELSDDLYCIGYGYIKVEGNYLYSGRTEPETEDSYFVINKSYSTHEEFSQDMIALGKKYEQESIILKAPGEDEHAYLHFLSGPDAGSVQDLGSWHTAGDVQASWDNWSSRKGKVFRFAKLSDFTPGMRHSSVNNYGISIARRNLRAGKKRLL